LSKVTRVVGLGAGGHAKVVIDILRLSGGVEVIGLVDPKPELWNVAVAGVPVLGGDDMLAVLSQEGVSHIFIGLGSVGDMQPRQRVYERALGAGFQIVPAIHPRSVISQSAILGIGPTIMAGAVINADARLGDDVVINTGSIVEHDCLIGNHVHIATGATLASTVNVGNGVHIGAGATIIQEITIGEGAIVGAGATVIRDVDPWTVVVGVPAETIRSRLADKPLETGKET
jgi:UDP-perosamine 4-acetyltransferase